jgi:hypothetical protein
MINFAIDFIVLLCFAASVGVIGFSVRTLVITRRSFYEDYRRRNRDGTN